MKKGILNEIMTSKAFNLKKIWKQQNELKQRKEKTHEENNMNKYE